MVNIRIPFQCASAQNSFFFFNTFLTQTLPAFLLLQAQAHAFVQCKPSVAHEFLWALGIVVSEHKVLFCGEKELVV